MLSEFERQQLQLLAALVGLQIAESGDQIRKAKALGKAALGETLELLEDDLASDSD